jgi:hypothetical protein
MPPGLDHIGQLFDLGQHPAELGDVADFQRDVQCDDVFSLFSFQWHVDSRHVDVLGANDARDFV